MACWRGGKAGTGWGMPHLACGCDGCEHQRVELGDHEVDEVLADSRGQRVDDDGLEHLRERTGEGGELRV